jgi:hypothetical protein
VNFLSYIPNFNQNQTYKERPVHSSDHLTLNCYQNNKL